MSLAAHNDRAVLFLCREPEQAAKAGLQWPESHQFFLMMTAMLHLQVVI